MWRPIALAIAVTSLVAFMFWVGMGATGKDACRGQCPLKPEYVVTSNPYLPIRRLEPAY
jgi:hypothetical protein